MQRNQSIDLIKIIAMIMVVGLHVEFGGGLEKSELLTLQYGISLIAIPLFFMVSGYLMQSKMLSITKPIIIHYCDVDKPWQITYYHKPFYNEWNYYKKISLWKNGLPLLPKKHFVQKIIKRFILWPLGLCLERDNQYVTRHSLI